MLFFLIGNFIVIKNYFSIGFHEIFNLVRPKTTDPSPFPFSLLHSSPSLPLPSHLKCLEFVWPSSLSSLPPPSSSPSLPFPLLLPSPSPSPIVFNDMAICIKVLMRFFCLFGQTLYTPPLPFSLPLLPPLPLDRPPPTFFLMTWPSECLQYEFNYFFHQIMKFT